MTTTQHDSTQAPQPAAPAAANLARCGQCGTPAPAEFVTQDNTVLLRKHCPACGPTDRIVSNDAAAWAAKRTDWPELMPEPDACSFACDTCGRSHQPTIVFLDVTNRCNMNCPICIATIREMKFDFNPPLAYFEKIFAALGQLDPPPNVQLFGGEPTVRNDLLDILAIAKRHGLRPCVVTNGLTLADEEYCKTLCAAKVRFRLAFDGPRREIYETLRSNGAVFEKKLAALANLDHHTNHKHAVVSCVARDVNEPYLGEMFDTLHRYPWIRDLGLIPLAETFEPGEYHVEQTTTPEDVEKMVNAHLPGKVEFVPTGVLEALRGPRRFFRRRSRSETLMLGGVHPNCESFALLLSDGQGYRSINDFLRVPFSQLAREILSTCRALEPALAKLNPDRRLDRLRGQIKILRAFWPMVRKTLVLKRYCRQCPTISLGKIVLGKFLGRRSKDLFRKHLVPQQALRVAILPFEEPDAIDRHRLHSCRAVFAYEDVADGAVRTIPACIWYQYRNPILKRISEAYDQANPA
jgi:7,8-dihydro-6-hydroxymethylpterin dimethyltransferase